jgi:hypothetical protein
MEEREPMHGRAKFRSVSQLTPLVSTLQTGRADELLLCRNICVCHNIGHSKIHTFLNVGNNFVVHFVQMYHACRFNTRRQY